MSESNAATICKAYEDFAYRNIAAVFAVLDAAIAWHVPGHSPLSGNFTGHDQVEDFFGAQWNFQEVRSASTYTTCWPTVTSSSRW
jgi:hypothetical protein